MVTDFKQKGIEFIAQAIKQDLAGDWTSAISLYAKGLQCLLELFKFAKNESRDHLRKRFIEYLERAEYLKELVTGTNVGEDTSECEDGASTSVSG